MGHGEHTLSDLLIYGIAFSIAAAIALAPQKAASGSYETHAPVHAGPRWSNDHHIANELVVAPDCTVVSSRPAEYVPGRDAWGRPVVPAEVPRHGAGLLPVPLQLEVHLGTKQLGGRTVELDTGPIIVDPGRTGPGGYPLHRDCTPGFK